MSLLFRKAVLRDLTAIEAIIGDAVARMLAQGKRQWDESYPTAEHILADILAGNGRVLTDECGTIAAYGAVVYTGEPAYEGLEGGDWLTPDNTPYVVVHRLAVSGSLLGRGFARRFLGAVEAEAASLGTASFKIDTNCDNDVMLHLLASAGFEYCGEITYPSGRRMAFEKLI